MQSMQCNAINAMQSMQYNQCIIVNHRFKGSHNYCRNPTNETTGPWCYVNNEEKWDFCDVPKCIQTHNEFTASQANCGKRPLLDFEINARRQKFDLLSRKKFWSKNSMIGTREAFLATSCFLNM